MRFNTTATMLIVFVIATLYVTTTSHLATQSFTTPYSFAVTQFATEQDSWYTEGDVEYWNRGAEFEGYWIKGWQSMFNGGNHKDRRYRYSYNRPLDSNLLWSDPSFLTLPFNKLSATPKKADWHVDCGESFISEIHTHYRSDFEDRSFDLWCQPLPPSFRGDFGSCTWTDRALTDYREDHDMDCPNGLINGIKSWWRGGSGFKDRHFSVRCCPIINTPMKVTSTQSDSVLLTGFSSRWNIGTLARSIQMSTFGYPQWNSDTIIDVQKTYSLTGAIDVHDVWVRICPKNGALTRFTYTIANDQFDFECAKLFNAFTSTDCAWTGYLNHFHTDFDLNCPNDGVIRGVDSYKSAQLNDRRFKLFCCALKRQPYVKDSTIQIALKPSSNPAAGTIGVITLDLCWNNHLYQGIVTPTAPDRWFVADDVVKHGSCGNLRRFRLETSVLADTDNLIVSSLQTFDNGVNYTIQGFKVHENSQVTSVTANTLPTAGVFIEYPNDYLISCNPA
eukprot:454346_1